MISYNFKCAANYIKDLKFDEMMSLVDSMREAIGDSSKDYGDRRIGQNIFDWASGVISQYELENKKP